MAFNRTNWEKHPQTTEYKVCILQPTIAMKRRVDQSSFIYPETQISYDAANPDSFPGSLANTEDDQLVAWYDSTEAEFKGLVRLRGTGANTIVISETSQGEIFFEDNDVFIIYDDYRPWIKVPRQTSDGAFFKDYQQGYSDQNEENRPIANAGPFYAGDVDPSTSKITVEFDASIASHAVADGATILAYLWDVQDGTITVGTTATAAITATFPAGQRWVELKVTDSNGKNSFARVCVIAVDESTQVSTPIGNLRLTGAVEIGWEASFNVYAEDVSGVLPGALVIVYANQIFGNTVGVVNGYTDREHIHFVGWLSNEGDTITGGEQTDDVLMTAVNLQGILARRIAFPQALVNVSASPTVWYEMYKNTYWRLVTYLLYWHSTVCLIADVVKPSYAGADLLPLKDTESVGGTMYDQLQYEAESAWALFTVDKIGRCYFERNPQTMTDAELAALTRTAILYNTDVRDTTRIERRHTPRISWLRGGGWLTSRTERTPYICVAPGVAPAQGTEQPSINGRWVADQDELNERTGNYYAWQVSEYPLIGVTLEHQGAPFDPAWGEYLEIEIDAATNRRGIEFDSDTDWRLLTYDILHDAMSGATEELLTMERIERGVDASTLIVPTGEWDDPDNWPDPPPFEWDEPPPDDFVAGDGQGSVIVGVFLGSNTYDDTSMIGVTNDLSAGSPSWTALIDGLPTVNPTGRPTTLTYINLDWHDADHALAFFTNGDIYRHTSWRTGGNWDELVSRSDIDTALAAQFPLHTITGWAVRSSIMHMASAGLFYLLIMVGDTRYLVRVTGYGSAIAVAPYILGGKDDGHPADGTPGSVQHKIQSGRMAPSIDDADKFYFATGTQINAPGNKRGFYWLFEWGNWNTASDDTTTYIISDGYYAGSPEVFGQMWVPQFKGDGSKNSGDTEMYIIGHGGTTTQHIRMTTTGGAAWTDWTADEHRPEGNFLPSGTPECDLEVFETFTNLTGVQVAFCQIALNDADYATDSLYVLPVWQAGATIKNDWTRYNLVTVDKVCFMGGWPYASGQFYIGLNDTGAVTLIKFTTDPSGGFVDKSGNLRSLWTADATITGQKIVRLTPFWGVED